MREDTNTIPTDPTKLLKEDHDKTKSLAKQIQETDDNEKKNKLFKELAKGLKLHFKLEEEIFYPELEVHEPTRDMALEGFEEHKQAKMVLEDLKDESVSKEDWDAKFKVLVEDLEHHIKEEEEETFPKVKQTLNPSELEAVGKKMKSEKVISQ